MKQGYEFSLNAETVDVLVINTCGFIKESKQESVDAINEVLVLKKKKRVKKIIVAGCLVQRYEHKLKQYFPDVDGWLGVEPLPSKYAPRTKITPVWIDFLKICEGCSHRCSYCAIPLIKGPLKSRPVGDILREVKAIERKGAKELNIIGQDSTAWGKDIYPHKDCAFLLKEIIRKIKNIHWVRLLYTHPRNFNEALLDVVTHEPRICKYVDLPIQHINDRILKLMKRGVTKKEIISLIKKIRKKNPRCVIRTSLIIGFPTETEKEFQELVAFLKDMRFEHAGAFLYSHEEGTPAFGFKGQVHYQTKRRRYNELMSVQKEISHEANKKYVGGTMEVLVEEKRDDVYIGRTQFSCYDIDGVVFLRKKGLKLGEFYEARITDAYEYDLVGE